ncbi:hypothetical protein DQY98_17075 [Salmonella enterica subsp. enterica serovar Saintpaul]|nr:hypothetical protein [Salmonella enterica subsp. enterica serovar Saintpaul]EBX0752300.1 hypothetical protein [Salmonella enterica subsp. enterica serovar Saintpaul]ECB0579479.1 hypothetical protein [Salmonella enterica subsp. enterica serovar Saintpaul]ECI6581033.1 hypothetical protein [Salmonella enterica subsp. enterica serovar Saintpaul]
MDGFAGGLLAGFSTVDNAMQQRKALGLREAALAQQQKNADRNYQLAQDEFGYRRESDQKYFDLKKERYAKDDDYRDKTFAVDSAYKNAQIGLESRRLRNAENQMDYMRRRQERDDQLKQDEPIAQGALNAYQKGDYKAAWDFINQLHDGHPMKQMIKPGYAQSSMNAMNGMRQILQGHPDDALKGLNKPDMLKNLSVTFGSELSSRIGMKDPKTGKTVKDAQIGAILPSPDGKGIVLGLDLTYDDGSKSHKPVTKYGSADPRDIDVLNIPGEQAIDFLMQRSDFSGGLQKGLEPLGYMMSDQGLSLAEQQKIAGNAAAGTARNGGDPTDTYNGMMGGAFGHTENQQKFQQSQATNTAKSWAGDNPSKLKFAQGALAKMPELFAPGNEKQLELYYQNYLGGNTEKAKNQSANVTAEGLRKLKQQQQSDFLYGSD